MNCGKCGQEKVVKKSTGELYCTRCLGRDRYAKYGGRGATPRIIELLKTTCPDGKSRIGILTFIALQTGVSRERVRQVAEQEGYIAARKVYKQEHTLACQNCGAEFYSRNAKKQCCSGKCYKEHFHKKYWKTVACKVCKKPITYRKALDKLGRSPTFCNKKCQGSYLYSHYHSSGNRPKHPTSRSGLKKSLPTDFTVMDFMVAFKYDGYSSAHGAVTKLISRGLIEKSLPSWGNRSAYYRVK